MAGRNSCQDRDLPSKSQCHQHKNRAWSGSGNSSNDGHRSAVRGVASPTRADPIDLRPQDHSLLAGETNTSPERERSTNFHEAESYGVSQADFQISEWYPIGDDDRSGNTVSADLDYPKFFLVQVLVKRTEF